MQRSATIYSPPHLDWNCTDWSTWKQLVVDKESLWSVAEGDFFLFLQRLVDDGFYRLNYHRLFGLKIRIHEQFSTVLWKETRRRSRDSSSSIFFRNFLENKLLNIEVELKHFSSITRTKQSFLTICIRNKETEKCLTFLKKKRLRLEEKKAQKLKILRRFWDLR